MGSGSDLDGKVMVTWFFNATKPQEHKTAYTILFLPVDLTLYSYIDGRC